jgi:hypothetical protein
MSVSDRTDLARHALEQLCSGSDPPPPSASTAIEDPSRGGGGVRLRHLERRDQPLARQARCVRRAARALRPGGRLALSDIVSGTQLPEGVTCDASLWAACIGGAMQRDRYREAIEAAGLQITAWCENEQYRFVSERADNAVRKYGFKSISPLARRGDRTA